MLHFSLKKYKLTSNKHIPSDYKYNCKKYRLELLAGIVDSLGTNVDNGNHLHIVYSQCANANVT